MNIELKRLPTKMAGKAVRITTGPIKKWHVVGAPSDEYNNSLWREGSPRVLKELTRLLTTPFPPHGEEGGWGEGRV